MRPTQKLPPSPLEETSRYLRAARGKSVDRTPIWFMRQAGRYMKEYMALREKYTMLERIHTAELAAEITLQPINKFGFDAAIIFSDILPPLQGMGLDLEFVTGKGPVFHNPISCNKDIDMLATPPAEATMGGTLKAIELVSAELTPRNVPVIGFCGAPFTLASYAIEGGGSKVYEKAKTLMYSEPAAWQRLMDKLVTVQADYLIKQVKSGASALQIFDSWAGVALGEEDYCHYVHPYNVKLIQMVKARVEVPVVYFATGTGGYLDKVKSNGADVIGVDWRTPLDKAWNLVGHDTPVQGNLEPIMLLAPWRELKHRIDRLLTQAANRNGHIFNLGHGILKTTPIENVQRTLDYVREQTAR